MTDSTTPQVSKPSVRILNSEEGDWVRLEVDGKLWDEGHSISQYMLKNLLEQVGCTVTIETREAEYFY